MKNRKLYEIILKSFIYFSLTITLLLLTFIIGWIFYKGIPFLTWDLLLTSPIHSKHHIGILPNIINTIYIILLTLIISLPIGLGTAIYLNEYSTNKKFSNIIEFTTETLSVIPSIIYGLVGMLFFVRLFNFKVSLLSGSLTMSIIILPTIIRTTQEALKCVPNNYREGALALGSGKWHMIKTIVLPSAIEGIITSCILSVGRIVGESAALLFTAGMGTVIASDVFSALKTGGGTLSVALYMYANERAEFDIAYAIGTVLLIIVLIINIGTKLTKNIIKNKQGANNNG